MYRRLVERLATSSHRPSALRDVIDGWFYTLEEDVLAAGSVATDPKGMPDAAALQHEVDQLLEQRLASVARTTPAFAAALRAYRRAALSGDTGVAEGLIAWIGGQPNVSAAAKRSAGIKGDLDHFGALGFLQGLLTVLRDSGHPGLLVVLDEIETLQRVRSDVREKGLNALRQLLDEMDGGRFPGLYLMITGTPAFYDGHQGVQRLPRWRSGSPPTSASRGSTIPARFRSGSRASTWTSSPSWEVASVTCTRRTPCLASQRPSTTPTSATWRRP